MTCAVNPLLLFDKGSTKTVRSIQVEQILHDFWGMNATMFKSAQQDATHSTGTSKSSAMPLSCAVEAWEDLSEEAWHEIVTKIPQRRGFGRPQADLRRTLNGILYVQHFRCSWRKMPQRYGSYVTCWRRLMKWQNDGTWKQIVQILAMVSPDLQLTPDRQFLDALKEA